MCMFCGGIIEGAAIAAAAFIISKRKKSNERKNILEKECRKEFLQRNKSKGNEELQRAKYLCTHRKRKV